jgi:aryl-alcohol dehydrogenase-like predicted oxidoreductase
MMRYIQIDPLDKPVSAIGLGTATGAFTPGTYSQAAELLARFLAAGGNCIDTAHIYGFGDSEKTLGRWFRESGRRGEVVLITKGCHPAVDPQDIFGHPWEPRVTPEAIRQDLGESLERLQTEYIDLYLLHRDDEAVPVGPLVAALNEEQQHGRIRAFGVSNWHVERIAAANRYATEHGLNGVVVSSPNLSLARPKQMLFPGTLFADEATRQWHRATQLPLLAWSSLAAGFLSGRYTPDHPGDESITEVYSLEENFERLRRAQTLAGRKNATLAQIALAYVLWQPFPVVALAGPTTVSHLEGALEALEVELSLEELKFLER